MADGGGGLGAAHLLDALDGAPVGLVTLDAGGRVEFANAVLRAAAGLAESPVGRPFAEACPLLGGPEDAGGAEAPIVWTRGARRLGRHPGPPRGRGGRARRPP